MKKIIPVFLLMLFFSSAFAEEIDIKGIRLGMTKKEISALYPNGTDNFTIGGVSNSLGLRLLFHEDKLAEMTFYFDTSGFNNVISAVKYKYPNIKCVKITDPRMPWFGSVECEYKQLTVVDNTTMNTGFVKLITSEFQQLQRAKFREREEARKKDM
jgi:hypothetical protein